MLGNLFSRNGEIKNLGKLCSTQTSVMKFRSSAISMFLCERKCRHLIFVFQVSRPSERMWTVTNHFGTKILQFCLVIVIEKIQMNRVLCVILCDHWADYGIGTSSWCYCLIWSGWCIGVSSHRIFTYATSIKWV